MTSEAESDEGLEFLPSFLDRKLRIELGILFRFSVLSKVYGVPV